MTAIGAMKLLVEDMLADEESSGALRVFLGTFSELTWDLSLSFSGTSRYRAQWFAWSMMVL